VAYQYAIVAKISWNDSFDVRTEFLFVLRWKRDLSTFCRDFASSEVFRHRAFDQSDCQRFVSLKADRSRRQNFRLGLGLGLDKLASAWPRSFFVNLAWKNVLSNAK